MIYTSTFGIRKLEYSAVNGFLLNDKRVKMNGGLPSPRRRLCWCSGTDKNMGNKTEIIEGNGV